MTKYLILGFLALSSVSMYAYKLTAEQVTKITELRKKLSELEIGAAKAPSAQVRKMWQNRIDAVKEQIRQIAPAAVSTTEEMTVIRSTEVPKVPSPEPAPQPMTRPY